MKVSTRSDLIEEDLCIPDVNKSRYYSPEEVQDAKVIWSNDRGHVKVQLKSGKTALLYSIDLDFEGDMR
jgi:hypothetical protein